MMPILERGNQNASQVLSGHPADFNLSQSSMREDITEDLCFEKAERRPTTFCAGCHVAIYDQFFLSVAHEAWHCHCLKCQVCSVNLDCQISCYYKDGRILCKDDYIKRCRSRRTVCSVCNVTINADELVMRISNGKDRSKSELGDFVYHLECFRCCLCSVVLRTGDHFGMRNDASVYCQRHFPSPADHGHHHDTTMPPFSLPFDVAQHNENDLPRNNAGKKTRGRQRRKNLTATFDSEPMERLVTGMEGGFINSVQRPPLDNYIDPQNLPLSYNMSSDESSAEGSGSAMMTSCSPSIMSSRQMTPLLMGHPPRPDSSSPTSSQHHRTKRMRTSFKHQQLRSMKQYFQINHNPDAKDLKQLAQKTGLTKRVLQVWFQNARAKYRRSMMKQDPSLRNGDLMGASASPESGDVSPHDKLVRCHSSPASGRHDNSPSPTFGQSSPSSYTPHATSTDNHIVMSPSRSQSADYY